MTIRKTERSGLLVCTSAFGPTDHVSVMIYLLQSMFFILCPTCRIQRVRELQNGRTVEFIWQHYTVNSCLILESEQ